MDIAITGSSGLIGRALADQLTADGHSVIHVVRRAVNRGESAITWDPVNDTIDAAAFEGIGAVVHLAGAGIGDERWTDARKALILESRTRGTALIASTLAALHTKPAVFLSGSAIGFYGDRGNDVLTEQSDHGDDFLSGICVPWEAETQPARDAGIRVVNLRTGIVLTTLGGALPKMLPLFKLGLGGRFGSGRQWWSWIALSDQISAMRFLLDHDVAGPVNLTAPEAVTNAQFTKTLGSVLGRPTILAVPTFGPKLLVGSELAQALLFTSARVKPEVLESAGFAFGYPELDSALRHALGRPSTKT